jgi:hypothetical protein
MMEYIQGIVLLLLWSESRRRRRKLLGRRWSVGYGRFWGCLVVSCSCALQGAATKGCALVVFSVPQMMGNS